MSLNEGYFENGIIKNYGRVIDNKGECKVGFWDEINLDSHHEKKKS